MLEEEFLEDLREINVLDKNNDSLIMIKDAMKCTVHEIMKHDIQFKSKLSSNTDEIKQAQKNMSKLNDYNW